MPAVDRNVLRLGVLELLYVDDVPDGVAVSEAMHLVRDLSTDESPAFVNGVLGHILRDKPALTA
jgi:N utilization substance protein B